MTRLHNMKKEMAKVASQMIPVDMPYMDIESKQENSTVGIKTGGANLQSKNSINVYDSSGGLNDTNTLTKKEAESILKKFHTDSIPEIKLREDSSGPTTINEKIPVKPIMEKTMNSTFYTQKSDEEGEEGGRRKKIGFHSTFNSKNATFHRMKEIREIKDMKYKKWASHLHALNLQKI